MGRPKGVERQPKNYRLPVPLLEQLRVRAESARRPETTEVEIALESHFRGGIPIGGSASAGRSPAGDGPGDFLVFNDLFRGDDLVAYKVVGECMADASIRPGDYVIVRRDAEPVEGKAVVACLDGEMVVKVYRKTRGVVWLHSCNTSAPALKLSPGPDSRLIGPLVGVVRKF